MISVICCYNDANQLEEMAASLTAQSIGHELVGIDNREQRYPSAAAALNAGAMQAAGDVLAFVHQDIRMHAADSLARLTAPVRADLAKQVISGAYGAVRPHQPESLYHGCPVVDSVDECCFAMSKDTWQWHPFDEEFCDGWHLYAVEACLWARCHGGTVVSGDGDGQFDIEHLSEGNMDNAYMRTFLRLMRRYRDLGYIATTCKSMPTSPLYFYLYFPLWRVKRKLMGNYPLMYKLKCLFLGRGGDANG